MAHGEAICTLRLVCCFANAGANQDPTITGQMLELVCYHRFAIVFAGVVQR